MGMGEFCYEAGVPFKRADERRVVRDRLRQHLHGHLSPDRRLIGPIHDPESARTDSFTEFVATDRVAEGTAVGVGASSVESQIGKLGRQVFGNQLEHALRRADPLESILAKVARLDTCKTGESLVRHRRQDDLTAVSRRLNSGSTVHRYPEVVGVPDFHVAGVDSHPHVQRTHHTPIERHELSLGVLRRANRVLHRGEDRDHTVAGVFGDGPGVAFDGVGDDRVVACQRHPHPLGLGLPQRRGFLDVGEEERQILGS